MKRVLSKIKILMLVLFVGATSNSFAQITVANTTPVTENFNGMAAGTTTPTNWKMQNSSSPTYAGGTSTLGFQASSGSPATGGLYNWGTSAGERALGAMTSGGFSSPNSVMGFYQNTNASAITDLSISYDCERYRINTAAASIQFFYSTDGSTWNAVTGGDVAAASLPTGASSYSYSPQLTVNVSAFNITGLNILNGNNFYLRWNLNTTGASSQGIGIDNVSVTATFSAGCSAPGTQATSFTSSSLASTTMTIGWTRGNGNNVLVIAKAGGSPTDPTAGTSYSANAAYGSGSAVGGGFAVYNGAGTSVNLTGLTANTSYSFAIYEYSTTGTCYNLTELTGTVSTLCDDPTAQATSVTFSSVAATTMTIGWTNGNGTNHIVLVKSGSAVSSNPVDGTSYTANAAFSSGTQIGTGNYAVYNSTGSSVNVTGLSANTTYHVAVYEFNSTSNCYQTTSPAINNTTTTSAASDVITAGGEPATISSIVNTVSPLSSATGVQVWQITVRDGGATMSDADALPTIVNAITIAQVSNTVSNWSQAIKTIEIFDGALNAGVATVTSTQIQFTGLTISIPDNSSKTLTFRMSLNCGIGASNADGDKFGFSISNTNFTTATSGSSQKLTGFGAAQSNTTSKNVIDVTATVLNFSTQPSTTAVSGSMSSVTVKAADACGNTDLGFTGSVSLTSTGTMTGSPATVSAVAGVATFSTITHTVVGTSLTLTAASGGVTSATSTTFNIITSTVFNPGDFAIIAVNTQVLSSGSADEVCFVTFEDIAPGTSFDLTDNGYERIYSGKWGNSEGMLRFTRKAGASTIPKGTVICVNGPDHAFDDANLNWFDLYVCGAYDDNNWTVTNLSTYYGLSQFDLNSSDQVWILQGGTFTDGSTGSAHDALHSGTMMYGWTATGWQSAINYASTSGSTMYPNMTCFTTDVAATTNKSKVKYTGPMTAATRLGWISRINTTSNWTGYSTNALYDGTVGAYDYNLINGGSSCSDITFNINSAVETDGMWTGAKTTDWFDCANWLTLKVPDSTINVQIDNVTNDPIIGASPTLYPTGAICQDLTITNTSGSGVLTINNASSYLTITRNTINNGTITASNGTTAFRKSSAQTFAGSGTTTLYNMTLNNAAGLSLTEDITISNSLNFTAGVISTDASNKIIITKTSVPTINGYGSTKFINGTLRHSVVAGTTYPFPIGDGTASTNYKRFDFVNTNLTTTTYLDGSVTSISEAGNNVDANDTTTQFGSLITDVLNNAVWTLTPNAQPGSGTYGVRLYTLNTGLSAADDDAFCPVKRADASTNYIDWNTFASSTTIPAASTAGRIYNSGNGYAQRLGYTSFSKHAIGKAVSPLPVELLYFYAKKKDKKVELTWSTASEINSSKFLVERGLDEEDFATILAVDAAGYSTTVRNYIDYDFNPNVGKNYYRLKQIDFDGKFMYSNIRMVDFEGKAKVDANIYKSAENQLRIETNIEDKNVVVNIFDSAGRLILNEIISLNNGVANFNFKPFSEGMYMVNVISNSNIITKKIIY